MREYTAEIIENKEIAAGIRSLRFRLPEKVRVRAGQFVNLSVGGLHLLRRPIAVCKAEGEEITVCFQVKGEGTKKLATMGAGLSLDVLLPLGNGFFVDEKEKKIALIGGGVGIFPMISLLRECAEKGNREISAYIGFRNKSAVCGLEEFSKANKFMAVTDDGSYGEKMNAVQAFVKDMAAGNIPDAAFACGPLPMLRALKAALKEAEGKGVKIPCYVSLEERMGCGIGACLVCVCNLTNGEHARVCKDGPVFNIDDVSL